MIKVEHRVISSIFISSTFNILMSLKSFIVFFSWYLSLAIILGFCCDKILDSVEGLNTIPIFFESLLVIMLVFFKIPGFE